MAIYFLQDAIDANAFIKIGYTGNLSERIQAVSRDEGFVLRLLAAIPGDYKQEAYFHRRFADHRVRGEWFEPVAELLDLVGILGVDETLVRKSDAEQEASLKAEDADIVEECSRICAALVERQMRPAPDTVDAALRRTADEVGVPFSSIWSLRYRPQTSVTAAFYRRLTKAAQPSSTVVAEAFLRQAEGGK